MIDCIIVGSGLAGISAALTLQSNGKTCKIFGTEKLSDKIAKAESIHNYPGLSDISGKDFQKALQEQLRLADLQIQKERVSGIYPVKDKFTVTTQEGNLYESRSILLSCGVESVKSLERETEFVGRGVSYCATCDGFLYKGKTIAVLCTSKKFEHEIEHLAGFAQTVYLIPMYKDREIEGENITVIMKMPKSIEGEKRLEKLVFPSAPLEGLSSELPIDGIFMLRDSLPPTVLLEGLQVENGHIFVNRDMSTNVKGCFAAGDCTGRPYQYAKAVGEGNVAAHSITAYLHE